MSLFTKLRNKRKKLNEKDSSGYSPKDYEKALTELDEPGADDFFGRKSFTEGASTVTAIVKAIVYISFIVVISCALAYFALSSVNDVFAFVKDDKTAEVTIPDMPTASEIAKELGDAGIINHPWLFKLYAKAKHVDENESRYKFVAGTYEVNANMNYDELLLSFVEKHIVTTIRVTIPEGYTCDDIINLFLEKGIGTRDGWIDAINNHDFGEDFPFIYDIPENSDRYYRLEGYLFPDTYDFYTEEPEYYYLRRMLVRFNNVVSGDIKKQIEKNGMTLDQVLTVASIIEKEAYFANDYAICASVIWNRLNAPKTYPNLECDSTIIYALSHERGHRVNELTSADLKFDNPYNSYLNAGLPPSPICNPSYTTIICAIEPEQTKYYFFVTDTGNNLLPAETRAQHNANVEKVRKEKEALEAASRG
ncbi:MAG: endolytic transglycosylase MltG [Clostridia bacterium]|nr:endolytic transglycosylase MltG [Clostridia bacterium]